MLQPTSQPAGYTQAPSHTFAQILGHNYWKVKKGFKKLKTYKINWTEQYTPSCYWVSNYVCSTGFFCEKNGTFSAVQFFVSSTNWSWKISTQFKATCVWTLKPFFSLLWVLQVLPCVLLTHTQAKSWSRHMWSCLEIKRFLFCFIFFVDHQDPSGCRIFKGKLHNLDLTPERNVLKGRKQVYLR